MEYTTFLQNNYPPQSDPSMADFKTLDEVEQILLDNRVDTPKKNRLQTHLYELYEKQMIGGRLYFLM